MASSIESSFRFIDILSDHRHVQVWRVERIATGEVCVLKKFQANDGAESSLVVSSAIDSFKLQRRIHSHKAVLGRQMHASHDGVLIEYPYLQPECWSVITSAQFLKNWTILLPEIALAVDHLHLLGLVHGDLKLGNIFWQPFSSDPEIKIADLDFLQKELSVPSARLFGTPGLIAPELEANECIVAQSDLFSLGKSMQRAVADLADDAPQDSTLLTLVELLTQSEYILRPRILLDALHSCGILSDEQLGKANRVLLGMLFRSHLTQACRKQLRQGKVDRLLSDLRLLGIPLELKELAASAFIVHSKHTWSVCRRLLMRSVIGRTGEYFSCIPTQPDIDETLNELDCLIAPTGSMSRSKSGDEIFETARQLRKQGRPLYADRILRELLQTGLATSITIPILRERANCATDLARHSESCKLSRQAADLLTGSAKAEVLHDAAMSAVRAGYLEDAESDIFEARNELTDHQQDSLSANLMRIEAWIAIGRGEFDVAETEITQIKAIANDIPDWVLLFRATYLSGICALRRGDLRSAHSILTEGLELAREQGLEDQVMPGLHP